MTRTLTLTAALAVAAVLFDPTVLLAQPPVGASRAPSPTVSPYLNLLRRGTVPAVNYYGLVRPEVQMRNNMQNLQRQLRQTQSDLDVMTGADFGLPFTGKSVSFLNTGGYFMTYAPAGGTTYGSFGTGAGGMGPGTVAGTGSRPLSGIRPLPPRR